MDNIEKQVEEKTEITKKDVVKKKKIFTNNDLKKAFIMSEILGKPRAKRKISR